MKKKNIIEAIMDGQKQYEETLKRLARCRENFYKAMQEKEPETQKKLEKGLNEIFANIKKG